LVGGSIIIITCKSYFGGENRTEIEKELYYLQPRRFAERGRPRC
jgi:hypothetical protein